ncbi:MAG TPA: hypothetical protein VJR29_01380 [bacterium]|nr:hypothetical protein [bacterium]
MSGEFKPVPAGAADLKSYQLYTEVCRGELQKVAPGATWDPSKAQVFNRSDGDGRFEVLYQDNEKNFTCAGQWLWPSQELLVRSGPIGQKTEPLAGSRIPDACRSTETMVGTEEFKGAVCREGEDPLLQKVADRESVRKFGEFCSAKLQAWGHSRFAASLGHVFDLKQSRVDNSVAGDGFYNLVFESRANQFVCEGTVDAGARQMFLRSGSPKQLNDGGATDAMVFSMTDACSLTTELFGPDEIGECKDQSERDRSIQDYVGSGVQVFLGVSGAYGSYRLASRIWKMRAVAFLRGLPLVRNLFPGLLAGEAFDTVAGMFVDEDHALRRYGRPIATVAGMALPELALRTSIGQRLVASTFGARALPWASRLTWGLAAVGIFDWVGKKILAYSDYEKSVKSRVTDRVYTDDGVYEWEWWDLIPAHLALKGLRRGCRALAPNMMESAVSWDNEDVEAQIRAEDQQNAVQADDFMAKTLPAFLHSDNREDINEAIVLLRDGVIELSDEEERWAEVLQEDGYADMRADFPQMNDEQAERFTRKFLMKRVQEAAAYLIFVPGAENEWVGELFNKDGTLKSEADSEGLYPYQRLQKRWAKPEAEKTSITSEAFEIVGTGDLMG